MHCGILFIFYNKTAASPAYVSNPFISNSETDTELCHYELIISCYDREDDLNVYGSSENACWTCFCNLVHSAIKHMSFREALVEASEYCNIVTETKVNENEKWAKE
jgi:hypothetical protein